MTRSFLAFWMGGAGSVPDAAPATQGVRSFMAFWMGGYGGTAVAGAPRGGIYYFKIMGGAGHE